MTIELREGTKCIYAAEPGETIRLLDDGRFLVLHHERVPKLYTLQNNELSYVELNPEAVR